MEEIQRQLNEIRAELDLLKASTTIPFEVESALRERFGLADFTPLSTSTKSVDDVTQAVNEGGIATYSVAKAPDGFRQILINGTLLYIPFYT